MPTSIDKAVGQEVRKEIIKNAPIDEQKTELLKAFYDELNFDSHTKLYVVTADEFNAFALPDNSIFVFDKVLKDINSYSELAALLGHEYAHIKYRHGMKGIAQSISWGLLGKVLTGGDNSGNFVRNSNLLLTLKNSREFETQADIQSLDLLRQQNIDLKGVTDLFHIIQNLSEPANEEIPSYFKTHPDIEDRIEKVTDEIKEKPGDKIHNQKLQDIFLQLTEEKTSP